MPPGTASVEMRNRCQAKDSRLPLLRGLDTKAANDAQSDHVLNI